MDARVNRFFFVFSEKLEKKENATVSLCLYILLTIYIIFYLVDFRVEHF